MAPSLKEGIAGQCLRSDNGDDATVPAALPDFFPTRRRTTGVSISHVLAQTAFGGLTPLVAT